ncbi:MAG: hypothetical protein JSR62_14910 [Nitrospira sp.]|nr:hypothetical protein [Nitrospira sp.]
MVETGVSFGVGLLIGGLGVMLGWGLLWLVVGAVGLMRNTCGWAIFMSSVSSSGIAALSLGGLLWGIDPARLGGHAFYLGLGGIPLALLTAAAFRLEDGRRIGPAFVEGSRMMLHQLLGLHEEGAGCGHCHEQPVEEHPCHQKPCFEPSCHDKPCEQKQ